MERPLPISERETRTGACLQGTVLLEQTGSELGPSAPYHRASHHAWWIQYGKEIGVGSRVFVPPKPTIAGKLLSKGSLYLSVGATALDLACRPFDS